MVQVPSILKLLPNPFKTEEDDGAKVRKSALLLLMQQLAPVSMHMARSLENLVISNWCTVWSAMLLGSKGFHNLLK
jgi:hypothetical protein